jgi:hypothetical protein
LLKVASVWRTSQNSVKPKFVLPIAPARRA